MLSPGKSPRILITDLERYCTATISAACVADHEAPQIAQALVWAEAKGIVTHGVRLLPVYLKRFQMGLVRSPAPVAIVREGACWSVLEGGIGFGIVVGNLAIRDVVKRASTQGLGACWVRNSTHFGAAGYYAWQIAAHEMIGCALSNAAPTMAIWGAAEPALGTNPIALAAPAGDGPPLLLDIATSVVSRQTINMARDRGVPIPPGWALDAHGRPTDRPDRAAVLLPFGQYKGSGLAMFIEILCGLVSEAASRHEISRLFHDFDRPERTGHFFMAVSLAHVADSAYSARMDQMVEALRGLRPMEGVARVLLPGEREFAIEAAHVREGIALDPAVAQDLFATGDALGVPRPETA